MTVDAENDSYVQSEEEVDYEDDQEVSFKEQTSQSELETETKDEADDGEVTDSESENDGEASTSSGREGQTLSQENRKRRIKILDIEMQDRLKEIRELLSQGGLDQSVKEVDKIQVENANRHKSEPGMNFNHNSNRNEVVNKGIIKDRQAGRRPHSVGQVNYDTTRSISDDTIYENAVPMKERRSSSSDEANGTDSSREILSMHFDDMNILDGSIVGTDSLNAREVD